MKVIVLGCGTSTGVPNIGCQCSVCTSDNPKNRRLRASIWMSWDGKGILVDTSTDLRHQALKFKVARVDAVLYTHSHADHIHGIDELRSYNALQKTEIPCYGSAQTMNYLQGAFRYIFSPEENGLTYIPRLTTRVIDGPFDLFGQGVVPLLAFHGPSGPVFGYRVGPFAYLTDVASVPDETLALMGGLEVLILDALRPSYHPSHLTIEAATDLASRIGAAQTYFTHMSHDAEYDEINASLPSGIELAYDGLQLDFQTPFGAGANRDGE
jgi:phosphoribosyl 1,2-cyclic phosphate phosphodiesterase